MVSFFSWFVYFTISSQSSEVSDVLSFTGKAVLKISVSMEFANHGHGDSRTKVESVSVLRYQMFSDSFVEESGDEHVCERRSCDVNQFVDGSLVGFSLLIVFDVLSVPETWSCFKYGILSGPVVGDTYGGGNPSSCEEDGIL